MKVNNPFVVQGYVDPAHFCDRERETKMLMSDIANGRNVTLLAPRRYGKSGLIKHALKQHSRKYAFVYVDLLSTTNLSEFVRLFANSVVGVLDSRLEKAASSFVNFFKSIRPTLRTGADGEVSVSFEMADSSAAATLDQIFDYLSKKVDQEIVIALDEFQQVAKYPEQGTEAMLRSRIQFMPPNVHFIFAGSQMHLISEMFSSPKRPFYQSTSFLPLDVIDEAKYCAFAKQFYQDDKRAFSAECFSSVYRRFDGITWYVQAVLNELWLLGGGLKDNSQIDIAVENLVERRRFNFHDLEVSQSDSARLLLRAVAREGVVAAPTSVGFIAAHGLRAPSSVAGAIKQLMEDELLYKTDAGYVIYDRLFGEYLKNS